MSKLLFDEQPLIVSRELAKLVGLNEALVLQQIHYWLDINKKANKNKHDGRHWTYNSIRAWHENEFDFWSVDTVKRTFSKLVKQKILLVENFNKDSRDKTKWYSIDYDVIETLKNPIGANCPNGKNTSKPLESPIGANCPNGLVHNAPTQECKMHQPLPETSTETSTEISNQSINQENLDNEEMIPVDTEDRLIEPYTYDFLLNVFGMDHIDISNNPFYDQAVNLILDTLNTRNNEVSLSKKNTIPMDSFVSRMLKLKRTHFEYVYESITKQTNVIKNMRSYLLTSLYQSITTMDSYYENRVNSDLHNYDENK